MDCVHRVMSYNYFRTEEYLIKLLSQCADIARAGAFSLSNDRYEAFCGAMTLELDIQGRRLAKHEFAFFNRCFRAATGRTQAKGFDGTMKDMLNVLRQLYNRWSGRRRFCVTRDDRFAWVPKDAAMNDIFCIFRGARMPYVS